MTRWERIGRGWFGKDRVTKEKGSKWGRAVLGLVREGQRWSLVRVACRLRRPHARCEG